MQVLIADTVTLVRSGLIHLLGTELPDSEFFEATSLAEVKSTLEAGIPDLLVLDPAIPGCEGEADLSALREAYGSLRIVILTASSDRLAVLSYLEWGMNACIVKSMPNEQALTAIRTVLSGGVYAPLMLTQLRRPNGPETACQAARPEIGQHAPALTDRQRDVLRLLSEGLSTKDIARALDLGVGTIKVHLSALYRTLGAHSRMEAVIRAGALKY